MCIEYHIQVNMYHVSDQGVDERMINVHYYYYQRERERGKTNRNAFCHTELDFVVVVCIVIITVVISVVLYLADKGERTALYKINKNVYPKTSKIIMTKYSKYIGFE